MNQFSLNHQSSNTLWYTTTPPPPPPTQTEHSQLKPYNYNNNNSNYNDADITTTTVITPTPPFDKEHMFEKPLTPSDVGKLNRLVIPKQHAEKYLPLATGSTAAPDSGGTGGGGILLGFEDEVGKCWKFRYSYWNSSQSYVLTKGWSRYVKDKKLDAGDVVLFDRHRFEPDRFFIGWRRRGSNTNVPVQVVSNGWTGRSTYNYNNCSNYDGYGNQLMHSQINYGAPHQISVYPNFPAQSIHQGSSVQVGQKAKKSGSGNSKRVRLFGVNLECQQDDDDQVVEDEPQTSDGSSLSSQGQGLGSDLGLGSSMAPTSYNNYMDYMGSYPPNHHNYMVLRD